MYSSPLISGQTLNYCITLFSIASLGSILQIFGGNWDVTSHLLLKPETFLTPSHTLLYGGIMLLLISTLASVYLLARHNEIKKDPLYFCFKMLIVGSALSIISGPSDFVWHEVFGVDGFLSPTHLLLITGMLINSIGTVLGLIRVNSFLKNRSLYALNRLFLVFALIALWLHLISYVYIFALPISNGDVFNFNLNPVLESFMALIFLPVINSFMVLLTLNTIKKFGYVSLVGIGLILLISFSNIVPSQELSIFLPYYLISVIPFIVIDILVYEKLRFFKNKSNSKNKLIYAGTIAGSIFYLIGYPLLPLALGNNLMPIDLSEFEFDTLVDILPIFMNSLSDVLPFTIIMGAIIGLIATLFFKRTKIIQKIIFKNGSTNLT